MIDNSTFNQALGQRLKNLRQNLDLSQESLAEALSTDRSYISKVESGSANINAYKLFLICEAMQISLADLFNQQKLLFNYKKEESIMTWTLEKVKKTLANINSKGYISIPDEMYRRDDGIVGQILEREFSVPENNLHLRDLGTFELKGMRWKKSKPNMLTLFHQKSTSGLTPIQIFDRFGYEKMSNRSNVMKKKLFTTIRGDKVNSLGFILKAYGENEIRLYFHDEYLATWDLSGARSKIDKVILAFADTEGMANTKSEKFHYTQAFLLDGVKDLSSAINSGAVVMDLCIDQPADRSKGPHDRGPHIRIPISKLSYLYERIEKLL